VVINVSEELKIEATRSSETSATTYKTTRRPNPEDHHRHLYHRENLKSQTATVRACFISRSVKNNEEDYYLSILLGLQIPNTNNSSSVEENWHMPSITSDAYL
jgi:hypothetical protein